MDSHDIIVACLIRLYTDSLLINRSTIPFLRFTLSLISKKQSGEPFPPMESIKEVLGSEPSVIIGRNLYDIFLNMLWSLRCFEDFDVFLKGLQVRFEVKTGATRRDARQKLKLGSTSPFGHYLRSLVSGNSRMAFSDLNLVWRLFLADRAETLPIWQKRNLEKLPFYIDGFAQMVEIQVSNDTYHTISDGVGVVRNR